MTGYRDAERNFYLNQLSVTSGNIVDLERDFLLSELSKTSGNVQDMWRDLFISKSIDPVVLNSAKKQGDAWKLFLSSEGLDGNVIDQRKQYFDDNS